MPSEHCLLRGYFLCFDNAVTYYRDPQNDNVCDSVLRAAYELLFVFLPGVFNIFMMTPKEYHLIRFRIISCAFPTYAGPSTRKPPAIPELIRFRICFSKEKNQLLGQSWVTA